MRSGNEMKNKNIGSEIGYDQKVIVKLGLKGLDELYCKNLMNIKIKERSFSNFQFKLYEEQKGVYGWIED